MDSIVTPASSTIISSMNDGDIQIVSNEHVYDYTSPIFQYTPTNITDYFGNQSDQVETDFNNNNYYNWTSEQRIDFFERIYEIEQYYGIDDLVYNDQISDIQFISDSLDRLELLCIGHVRWDYFLSRIEYIENVVNRNKEMITIKKDLFNTTSNNTLFISKNKKRRIRRKKNQIENNSCTICCTYTFKSKRMSCNTCNGWICHDCFDKCTKKECPFCRTSFFKHTLSQIKASILIGESIDVYSDRASIQQYITSLQAIAQEFENENNRLAYSTQ